jgi:hypothetical protein
LEKLNRKPFKLKGFDKGKVAAVTDWDGGTLAALPGGCKAGVFLRAEAKAAIEVIAALPGDHEFSPTPRCVLPRPAVTEILIGYESPATEAPGANYYPDCDYGAVSLRRSSSALTSGDIPAGGEFAVTVGSLMGRATATPMPPCR